MHDRLAEEIEDLILDRIGYKLQPSEATELVEEILETVKEIISEYLGG